MFLQNQLQQSKERLKITDMNLVKPPKWKSIHLSYQKTIGLKRTGVVLVLPNHSIESGDSLLIIRKVASLRRIVPQHLQLNRTEVRNM